MIAEAIYLELGNLNQRKSRRRERQTHRERREERESKRERSELKKIITIKCIVRASGRP